MRRTLAKPLAVTTNTTTDTIKAPFAASPFGRLLRDVVRRPDWQSTGVKGTTLRGILGINGWICANGGPVIKSYGFLQLPPGTCGSTA
ncbi:hypothetical protein ACGFZP_08790 [Kitasatospora sp. NPDC048239]|uniref:hypothetical protein n=1 Tax=Kitasatospora sp. NPDC048239 TaxID=3364046 RepID=UPI00371624B0